MVNDKLGQALHRVYKIVESKNNIHILQTNEMSRADREILMKNSWLQKRNERQDSYQTVLEVFDSQEVM